MGYLTPPPSPAPVIVYKDVGGIVTDYEKQTEIYERQGREVRLHECRSACTLALSLPNVCVYPDSVLKFHQAYNAWTREADLRASAKLFFSYPAAVQGRLGHLTREYKVLTGDQLIALGVRDCNDNDRILIAAPKPPEPPRAGSNPLGEILQNVRTAVASALARPNETPEEPLRVVVPDRKPIPPTMAHLSGGTDAARTGTLLIRPPPETFAPAPRLFGDTKTDAAYGDAPLPPRRPALALLLGKGSAPLAFTQLMQGARPILPETQFEPSGASGH